MGGSPSETVVKEHFNEWCTVVYHCVQNERDRLARRRDVGLATWLLAASIVVGGASWLTYHLISPETPASTPLPPDKANILAFPVFLWLFLAGLSIWFGRRFPAPTLKFGAPAARPSPPGAAP
jgi:hypothetical protein